MNHHATARKTLVTEIDLRDPLPDLPLGDGASDYSAAWILVRFHTQPIGTVSFDHSGHDVRALLARTIATRLGDAEPLKGNPSVEELLLEGSGLSQTPEIAKRLDDRAGVARSGPSISVVVCTRNRPGQLEACIEALETQEYHAFELVVVDNTDGDPETSSIARAATRSLSVQYVIEPRVGLSRARNRGAEAATGDVVAFLDDDATPDGYWLAELACGYELVENVACVNGPILPAELDTPGQDWISRYGGHSKGRDFTEQVFDASDPAGQSPLYPLPPFGAGGNMSFRRDVLAELGGFDHALGAGTPAGGGEETLHFTRLLLGGHRIVYRPGAFVWHRDQTSLEGLRGQVRGRGKSITAYYTALLWSQPRLALPLARLVQDGVRELRHGPQSVRRVSLDDGYPRALVRAHRAGLLAGPLAYARGRVAARRSSPTR